MTAVLHKGFADMRRKRLQTAVIALVTVLSALAATLALNLLVESDAPYDHAFAQANGPHLVVTFDGAQGSSAEVATTAHAPGVTETTGPMPMANASIEFTRQGPDVASPAGLTANATIIGRDSPDTSVDRLSIVAGRWVQSPSEVVLSRRFADLAGVGDTVSLPETAGTPTLTVVGIADSISPAADAWVIPSLASSLIPSKAGQLQSSSSAEWVMEYRVSNPTSPENLAQILDRISRAVPAGSVLGSVSWLDVKKSADLTAAVMVPFLVAFSAFALLAAAFVISNVIAGVVIADRRQIGIMKSVGFTPGQVTGVLLVEVLAPVVIGCAIGIPLGTLASQPFLQQTADALGLPAPFSASIPVDIAVLTMTLLIAVMASALPAASAGGLSAIAAMSRGSGPSNQRGGRLIASLSRLPVAAPLRLGLAELIGRPVRAAMTGMAVLLGASTVVFAIGLNLSLTMVAQRLIRDQQVQVDVNVGPGQSAGQIENLLHSTQGTSRFVAEGQDKVRIPHVAAPIPYYGYGGDASWLGYAMISGRWFVAPGEVVAPSHLIDVSGLALGQSFTATLNGQPVHLRLVGEVFDQTGDDLLLRGSWSTISALDTNAALDRFEVQLMPGVDAPQYASDLQSAGGPSTDVGVVRNSGVQGAFILINSVVAGLALVLTAIAVAGVLNTVMLSTRERRREIAILKSVGMAPGQVVVMVVSSVALIGLIAGVIGVPVGLGLHHQILSSMAEIATNTRVPASFYAVLGVMPLVGLAFAGAMIAAAGSWVPAQWAAREQVAAALQTE